MYRLDVKTGQYENLGPSKDPRGKQVSAYGMPTDQSEQRLSARIRRHQHRAARRQDRHDHHLRRRRSRIRGRGAAGSMSRTGCGSPNMAATPSRCSIRRRRPSRNIRSRPSSATPTTWRRTRTPREVWTGSMLNDRVPRLDTKSGKITEYLLPRPTNIRRVFVQDTGAATDALGRQQSRRLDRQGRAARLGVFFGSTTNMMAGLARPSSHQETEKASWLLSRAAETWQARANSTASQRSARERPSCD